MDALWIAVEIVSQWPEHQVRGTKKWEADWLINFDCNNEVGFDLYVGPNGLVY